MLVLGRTWKTESQSAFPTRVCLPPLPQETLQRKALMLAAHGQRCPSPCNLVFPSGHAAQPEQAFLALVILQHEEGPESVFKDFSLARRAVQQDSAGCLGVFSLGHIYLVKGFCRVYQLEHARKKHAWQGQKAS